MLALFVGGSAGAVQRGGAGIDQVDEAVLGHAFGLMASDTLAGLRTPVGAHVMEAGGGAGDQSAQHHGHAVQGVILGGKGGGLLRAVPVEGGGHDRLGEVRIGQPVGPVALALEAACNRILA